MQMRDVTGFKTHFHPGSVLVNGYAATEAGTICQFVMDHHTELVAERIPAGVPVPGMTVQLVDDRGHAAVGAVGEITVDGETLASGHWDAENRSIVPFARRPLPLGDLGFQLPDGRVFLTGRGDLTVKVHGYRVHLGEVEGVVARLAGVKEAVVVPRTTSHGDTTLVVYYVPANGNVPAAEELRWVVASVLPGPLVPTVFVAVQDLPRLPGGKINRHSLAYQAMSEVPRLTEDVVYPSQTAARLARIWMEVLGVSSIPPEADFFTLGGDSIMVFRVLNHIRGEFDVEVSVLEFFAYSTLSTLANAIEAHLGT
jgi:acyl-coenzyme A synthetase/AMP-(fatty) acid ligase/acyl carrier protein